MPSGSLNLVMFDFFPGDSLKGYSLIGPEDPVASIVISYRILGEYLSKVWANPYKLEALERLLLWS